jgi:hypothetical protein
MHYNESRSVTSGRTINRNKTLIVTIIPSIIIKTYALEDGMVK